MSRVLLAVMTAANIFMIMMSFVASILACTNVCCDPVQSSVSKMKLINWASCGTKISNCL